MPLTPRQKRFCERYVECGIGKQAATEAGYKESGAVFRGSRLLKMPEVQTYITELRAEIAERNQVTQDEVIEIFRDAIKGGKDAKQYGPVVRGGEMLGKSIGMFKDDIELTILQKTSDADLIKELAQGNPEKEAALRILLGAGNTFDSPDTPAE